MIQAVLDNIREQAARIAIQYTNGRENAMLRGGNSEEIADHCKRVIYLWGVINYTYLDGTTPYIGGTAVTDAYVFEASTKLWHYSGQFADVDLSDYSTIVADDGEGGAVQPGETADTLDDHRVGSQRVTIGQNVVTFIKDGVASPLPSNDYTVIAWVEGDSGFRQSNLQPSTYVASGFVVDDVLEAGLIRYQAVLNT